MELKVQQNVDLSQFTTYRTGGPATYFGQARTWQQIYGYREFAKNNHIPYIIIGGGSNVLFADEGYPGLVILNQMDKLRIHGKNLTADSAVSTSKLVLLAAKHNLGGISGLALVPGSIGGAVYGNAGTPEMSISDVFLHAEILPEKSNKPIIVGPDYCKFGYRTSYFKKSKDIILSVTLKLKPTPAALIKTEINSQVKMRTKQPVGLSCGSFFKNPGQFPSAGWLIDQAGCKGMEIGGARVSEKHANWIMNTGKAKSSDILNLAMEVYKRVEEKYSISLEPEVQILPTSPFMKI